MNLDDTATVYSHPAMELFSKKCGEAKQDTVVSAALFLMESAKSFVTATWVKSSDGITASATQVAEDELEAVELNVACGLESLKGSMVTPCIFLQIHSVECFLKALLVMQERLENIESETLQAENIWGHSLSALYRKLDEDYKGMTMLSTLYGRQEELEAGLDKADNIVARYWKTHQKDGVGFEGKLGGWLEKQFPLFLWVYLQGCKAYILGADQKTEVKDILSAMEFILFREVGMEVVVAGSPEWEALCSSNG